MRTFAKTMPELNIKISSFFVETLTELIDRITKTLQGDLVLDIEPLDDDPDLAEAWREGLLESLREDCQFLLSLVNHEKFGQDKMTFGDDKAEAILRASAAVRLKIQQTFLVDIAGEDLETGEVDFYSLKPDVQKVFACYVFLANLQEIILQELNPEYGQIEEGDDF